MIGKPGTILKPTNKQRLPEDVEAFVRDQERLQMLRKMIPRDSGSDADFDRLTRLAKMNFDVPIALVSLVDEDEQWFKSADGLNESETEVGASFCAHAISQREGGSFVVNDATKDPRFASNRLVTGEPHIRFYAGHPISLGDNRVGTLCVIDTKPREHVTSEQLESLRTLAELASSLFELKYTETEASSARRKLDESEIRHDLAHYAANVSNWMWNADRHEVNCDNLMRQQLSLPSEGVISQEDFLNAIDPAQRDEVHSAIDNALPGQSGFDLKFRAADSNRWFRIAGKAAPTTQSKKPVTVLGVLIETTELRNSQERTRSLLLELNHRVKNTLAILQALSSQSLRGTSSAEEYNSVFFGRLQSISALHGMLSNNNWSSIDLREVVHSQIEGFEGASERVHVDIPKVTLSPDQALGLGMLFHELASDAEHAGILSEANKGGRISISGHLTSGEVPELTLRWIDKGRQDHAVGDDRRSRSSLTLATRSLDKVLGSRVEISGTENGMVADISFPL